MTTTSKSAAHTPGPWRWQGEDYRGGWGWQLLVGPDGQGILCGEKDGKPYPFLRAAMAIEPQYCKTGFAADENSTPCVHVQQADAALIAAAPDLLRELKKARDRLANALRIGGSSPEYIAEALASHDAAIARAEGRS